ncbi:MAG TPA: DUF1501 domain-containing protein [Caulobacteraceae bacterium]|nr:DUF1501 domain-containing protein [Caulobacteraceae bacterium]
MLDRRQWLLGAGAATGLAGLPRIAFAAAETDRRLVVVMLRGAMDGLSAAPPFGDPDYESARTGLAIARPGAAGGALPLDATFGLNPALERVAARYAAKEVIVFHAIASPYRDRSHFDGQNLLENGSTTPYGLADGWLNRALAGLPGSSVAGRPELGIALAPAMPLMLRGPAPVTSWSPSVLPGPSADFVARASRLYAATDPRLAGALSAAAEANGAAGGMGAPGAGGDAFVTLMSAAAKFLSAPNGPCVAMVDSTGWDTHANQVGPYNVLTRNLMALDQGLDALAVGLGPLWSRTAVLVMSEFGRTVAMNGTAGSDHGTASAAFLLGGAVAGGRVLADWPGLKPANLFAGRDLRPTSDLRSAMKAALRDHLGADPAHIDRVVFPGSGEAKSFDGLFRQA